MQHMGVSIGNGGTSSRFMRCNVVENPWQRQNVNKSTQNAPKMHHFTSKSGTPLATPYLRCGQWPLALASTWKNHAGAHVVTSAERRRLCFLPVCLPVYLSVHRITQKIKVKHYFDDFFGRVGWGAVQETIRFWWRSGSRSRSGIPGSG